jgi:transcriptional regulator with XRE-family HTH domain
MTETRDGQMEALGAFIRSKRKLANMSLRQLAERTRLSNPYLSQIERGLHQPSVRVIRLISDALNLSTETLLAQAGVLRHDHGADGAERRQGVEEAIAADDRLSAEQQSALIAVFRSMLSTGSPETGTRVSGGRTSQKADNASSPAITIHQRD